MGAKKKSPKKRIYDAFPRRKEATALAQDLNRSTPPQKGCPDGAGARVSRYGRAPRGQRGLTYAVFVNASCRLV
jgi:hypothetical protein